MGKDYMSVSRDILYGNIDRFFKSVEIKGGCWAWNRYINEDGYGKFGFKWGFKNFTKESAHIISWVIRHRQNVPDGMEVCHTCDNPQCTRPSHLFVATHADNIKDMATKGRHWDSSGVNSWNALLTDDAVREIRSSGNNKSELAKQFGVSRCAINDVLSGRSWKHVR